MAKTKTVKAKVSKVKPKKRMSKGAKYPWEVWHLNTVLWSRKVIDKHYSCYQAFATEEQAKACIEKTPALIAPVIRHVDIPPMPY